MSQFVASGLPVDNVTMPGNAAFAKAKELNWKSSDLSDDELDNASCKLGLLGRDPASCTAEEEIRCPTG